MIGSRWVINRYFVAAIILGLLTLVNTVNAEIPLYGESEPDLTLDRALNLETKEPFFYTRLSQPPPLKGSLIPGAVIHPDLRRASPNSKGPSRTPSRGRDRGRDRD